MGAPDSMGAPFSIDCVKSRLSGDRDDGHDLLLEVTGIAAVVVCPDRSCEVPRACRDVAVVVADESLEPSAPSLLHLNASPLPARQLAPLGVADRHRAALV